MGICRELEGYVSKAKPGSKLPSERELARSFSCNVLTIRKALEPLAKSGLIIKRAGSGSFVAEIVSCPPAVERNPRRLGVLIHSASDAYAVEVLRSVNLSASSRNLELRSLWVKDFHKEASLAAHTLLSEGCSAIILPWFPLEQTAAISSFIKESPLPVSVSVLIPGFEASCFEVPSLFGRGTHTQTEAACEYLRLLGSEAIAFVGPDSIENITMQARLSAYSRFVFRRGMENLSCPLGPDSASMDSLAASFARRRGRLAVFCHDDLHATRLMTAMHKLGLSAPEDFRILGCNNTNEAKFNDPPLSSVYDDWAYPGEALVRNALGLASGKPDQSEMGPAHHLAVRGSCGGLAILQDLKRSLDGSSLILEVGK